jgi:hypothetical protein
MPLPFLNIVAEQKKSPTGVGLEELERREFLKPRRIYEVLTLPFAFPALGHDVKQVYRTHSRDLLAQKCELFVPLPFPM